jgi:hypothetical protein
VTPASEGKSRASLPGCPDKLFQNQHVYYAIKSCSSPSSTTASFRSISTASGPETSLPKDGSNPPFLRRPIVARAPGVPDTGAEF